MLIAFVLSMPNVGSWNGKWSGSEKLYAIVKNIRSKKLAEKIIAEESFYHNFGDGWGASVSVKQVDTKTAAKIRRKTQGFCGYDWMVTSIIGNLEIKAR